MDDMKKIDCIILAGHGTALGSMVAYLRRFESMDVLWTDVNAIKKELTNFVTGSYTHHALVIDNLGYRERIDSILEYCGDNYTLIVMTRDPVEQLKSVVNTYLYWWSLSSIGVANASSIDNTLFYECGSSERLFNETLRSQFLWPVASLLPMLATRAGNMIVTDVADLSLEEGMSTMSRVSHAIYGKLDACTVKSPQSLLFSRDNRFVGKIEKFRNVGDFLFTLEPCPEMFCPFLWKDTSIALCYDPAEIGFRVGDFKGNIAFICDELEIAQSQLSKKDFVEKVRGIVEENNKELLRYYCEDMSRRVGTAQKIYSAISMSADGIASLLRSNSELYAIVRKEIQDLAEMLAVYGSDQVKLWHSSRHLLVQHGDFFYRPALQQFEVLRMQIEEMREALRFACHKLAKRS